MSDDAEPLAAPPPGAIALLREHRDFRRYLIGQGISLIGLWMQQVAQAAVVVDLAGEGARSTVMATVTLASSAPMVLLLLSGGVVADRFDRRRVLIITNLCLAALAFVYGGLVGTGALRLGHVYALAVILGIVAAFEMPATSAMVPQLVPPQAIAMAVAIHQALFHGARVLGPVLSGVLLKVTSPTAAFIANGVSYFAAIASLLIIRPRPVARPPTKGGAAVYKEGLVFAMREPKVRALLGYSTLMAAFVFPFLIVFIPVFVKDPAILASDNDGLGFTMAATGLGAVSGAVFLMFVKERRGRMIVLAATVVGASLAAASQAPSVAILMILCVPFTMGVSTTMGLANTLVQVLTPDELRGRVMGLWAMIFVGVMPISAVLLGPLADAIGLRTTVLLMSGALLVTGIPWLLRQKVWRM